MEHAEIEKLVEKQRDFFAGGVTLGLPFRKKALRRLYRALEKYEDELLGALAKDLGRDRTESYMCELGFAKSEITYMLRHMDSFAREKRVPAALAQFPARCFVTPSPYGNVLIMSPWNYPLLLTLEPLTDALAAGNTAIVKPSAYAPASSEVLAMLIEETFPEKYVAVVTGGREENSALLDCRFDMIFFTGSPAVGSEVLKKAAVHITPAVLELGGKSPVIVDETADIALAARRIVFGKYLNCGQTCVAPDYILCAESVREKLVTALLSEIQRQYGQKPLAGQDCGKIVNRRHFDRLSALLADAGGREGVTIYGGETDPDTLSIAPTVIDPATRDMALMKEEIFGPLLPVLSFRDFYETVADLDLHEHPLAMYIFSSDRAHIAYALKHIRFGGGAVNDTVMHLASPFLPFGGVGKSGMGSYHGRAGFDAFSHKKSILRRGLPADLPLRYRPRGRISEYLLRFLLR